LGFIRFYGEPLVDLTRIKKEKLRREGRREEKEEEGRRFPLLVVP